MNKLAQIAPVIVALVGAHALVKFVFFLLPYARRRRALDKSYGGRATATRVSAAVLLGMTLALSALLFIRGVDDVSFLGGLWIVTKKIQVYFHRFHAELSPDR